MRSFIPNGPGCGSWRTLPPAPHDRVALREDLSGLLLDRRVGKELVDAVHAVPDIEDQEFTGAFLRLFHRHIHHMA